MKYLIFLFLALFNFVIGEEIDFNPNEPLVVHFQSGRDFFVGNFEFMGRQKDCLPNGEFAKEESQWEEDRPKFGDLMLIQEINIEHLLGGSYRYIARLQNLRNGISEYYQTRVINNSNRIKVAKAIRIKTKNPVDGYSKVQLEDGEVLEIRKSFSMHSPFVDSSLMKSKDFILLPEDVLEISEGSRRDRVPHTFYLNIHVYRNNELLPVDMVADWTNSRKSFLEPLATNRFEIEYIQWYDEVFLRNFIDWRGFPYPGPPERRVPFLLLSPVGYKKSGTVTFKSVEDDVFIFVDKEGIEMIVKKRPYLKWTPPGKMGF